MLPLKLILASQSPRRREILKDAGYGFATYPSNSSESFSENLTLRQNIRRIAEEKVEVVRSTITSRNKRGFLILGADTVVVLGRKVLGKPKSRREARAMLRSMSGKTHLVWTAYSVFNSRSGERFTKIVQTKVRFRVLMHSEIEEYLDSGEPFDKAGAYGIQGLARAFINRVEGDLLNVIGLPLNDFQAELRRRKWSVLRSSKSAGKNR
jgi:septum formation protein